MSLTGKRIAILAEDNYQELELWYPLLRLREAGAEVVVIQVQKLSRSRIALRELPNPRFWPGSGDPG